MTTTAKTPRGAPVGALPTPRRSVRRQSRGQSRGRPQGSSVPLTGRGGIVLVFGIALFGSLLGSRSLLDIGVLPGIAFVVACVLAAVATRPAGLLTMAVSPPLIFFVVTLITSTVDAVGDGSLVRSAFVGLVTALASSAPWLFLGTLLVVGIAIRRGLPANLRELRDRLAGDHPVEDAYDDDPVRWDEPQAR